MAWAYQSRLERLQAYEREKTKVHVSLLELVELCSVFCQDNQWARMSNFETGCPTSRHTVWSW